MKRKCIFCRYFNALEECILKGQKVSPNGTCKKHKYSSNVRGCCKAKIV